MVRQKKKKENRKKLKLCEVIPLSQNEAPLTTSKSAATRKMQQLHNKPCVTTRRMRTSAPTPSSLVPFPQANTRK